MTLDIKKVRYSSRYGYSLEWHEPYSIRISAKEALYLSFFMRYLYLSDEEFQEAFDSEERAAVRKYLKKAWDNRQEAIEELDEEPPFQQLQRALKTSLTWALDSLGQDWGTYLTQHLGWQPGDVK